MSALKAELPAMLRSGLKGTGLGKLLTQEDDGMARLMLGLGEALPEPWG